jgi:hypothetical protein
VDVGKDVIAVAVRLPGDGPDGRQILKRTFRTFYGVLREAARWATRSPSSQPPDPATTGHAPNRRSPAGVRCRAPSRGPFSYQQSPT